MTAAKIRSFSYASRACTLQQLHRWAGTRAMVGAFVRLELPMFKWLGRPVWR